MKHTLDNGLRLVVEERPSSRVVGLQMWVNVGSADESAPEAGLAHVHEHMLFKGTDRRGVGQIAGEVEAAGGEINAWTSFDQTVYHVVISSRFWERGLEVLADAIRRPSFDPEELTREREVILEELRHARDLPSREVSRRLFETAYRVHPYRRPVIGTMETLERFTREDVLAFYRARYRPDRMVLAVAGNIPAGEVAAAAARELGDWSPGPATSLPARPAEPPQEALRAVVATDRIHEAHVALGFHLPAVNDPDVPALDVLALLLGQGTSCRLNQEIRRRRRLVTDVQAFTYTPADPGLLLVSATTTPERALRAVSALAEELFRLVHDPVPAEEVRKARTMVEADAIFQRETAEGAARRLGYWESVTGDPHGEIAYLEEAARVGSEDLLRVAAAYLRPDNLTVSLLLPEGETPPPTEGDIERLVRQAWDRVAARYTDVALPPRAGQVTAVTLDNGMRLLVVEDRSVPIVALRALYAGGLRQETADRAGIHTFVAEMLTHGTATRSAEEIAGAVDGLAGQLSGFSGRNSFGLSAEFLARDFEAGLTLFADSLLHPSFPPDEVEKLRSILLEEVRAQEDNPSGLVFRAFGEALFGEHPYHLDVLGTANSLSRLTREDLAGHHERFFPPAGATLAIIGDVDPVRAVREARRHFGGDGRERAPLPAVGPWRPADAPAVVLRERAQAQAHFVLGFPGVTIHDADRFPLEVLSTVLGGQGGRLFLDVRERRGLAYSVTALNLEGVEPGFFAVYAATSPDRLPETVAAVREVLASVRDQPLPEQELERARQYLVGVHDIGLQRIGALASTMTFDEAFGMGHDAWRRYSDGIRAVTAEDVQRVAQRILGAVETLAVLAPKGTEVPGLKRQED